MLLLYNRIHFHFNIHIHSHSPRLASPRLLNAYSQSVSLYLSLCSLCPSELFSPDALRTALRRALWWVLRRLLSGVSALSTDHFLSSKFNSIQFLYSRSDPRAIECFSLRRLLVPNTWVTASLTTPVSVLSRCSFFFSHSSTPSHFFDISLS